MNLYLVHKLLEAANNQPYGFLKVHGRDLAREVELMSEAGLVESSETVRGLETYRVIKRVTDTGMSFLRAFKDRPLVGAQTSNSFNRSSQAVACCYNSK
ncbi:MAG: hypothetical protein ACJ8M4_07605 [Chthoniobacterales bacterium]